MSATMTISDYVSRFSGANREGFAPLQLRMLKLAEESSSETEALEIYYDLHADCALRKKVKANKPKKTEKTDEELLEEKRVKQFTKYQKMMIALDVKDDGDDEDALTTSSVFDLLTSEERKAMNVAIKNYKSVIGKNAIQKLLKTKDKGDKKTVGDLREVRVKGAGEEGGRVGSRVNWTGEVACVKLDGDNYIDYNIVECKRLKGASFELDEDEAWIVDYSVKGVQSQIKMKKGYMDRCYPITYIREGGCPCAIKTEDKAIYKNTRPESEKGCWIKQKKNWGLFPCNMKISENGKCYRHNKGTGDFKIWEREMMLLEADVSE